MTEANVQVTETVTEEVVLDDKATTAEETTTKADVTFTEDKQEATDKVEGDKQTDKQDDTADDKTAALPDNWRELAAAGDEDSLKLLKRYGSLNGVVKALVEKEKLIRSGKLKRDMPDPKDDKAMAEWRKDQGIPDDPTGYKLSDNVTKRLIDDDKPILSSFTEFAHSKNLPPTAVDAAAEWYVEMQEKAVEQQIATDTSHGEECEDALREAWSRDEYKGNLSLAKRFIGDATGLGDTWTEARLPDGRKLGSIPDFVMWASDRGREAFGDVVFASADSEAKHASRKTEIEGIMNSDIDRYWKEGLDKEYQTIVERETKRRK